MKKIISVILVLVLCLSAASALAAKSPDPSDSYEVYYPTPKQEGKFTVDLNSTIAADLLDMLKKAESVDDFFGETIIDDKGNTALLEAVNKAIGEALSSGKMDQFVAEANELASGNILEGLLEDQ